MSVTRVGQVTLRRYNQLVRQSKEWVAAHTKAQWAIGEAALEIEPIRHRGGQQAGPGEELLTVAESMQMFADDIGVPVTTITKYRWVASRWPQERRDSAVSHEIHQTLAAISDDRKRFAAIKRPPRDKRTGQRRWTPDSAKREVGWQVATPVTTSEKVEKIHDLATDDTVAAVVATSLLHRPEVASRAMTDTVARRAVNRAQVDHAQQAGQIVRQRNPVLGHLERTTDFVDLIGTCSGFVASVGRVLPRLRGHQFTGQEKTAISKQVLRVRTAADWIEMAVTSGNVTLDDELAKILRGE